VAVGELRRAPAVDRAPDELLGADDEAEADEDDDGVLPTQTVDAVVVGAEPRLARAQHRLEEAIHRRRRRRRRERRRRRRLQRRPTVICLDTLSRRRPSHARPS